MKKDVSIDFDKIITSTPDQDDDGMRTCQECGSRFQIEECMDDDMALCDDCFQERLEEDNEPLDDDDGDDEEYRESLTIEKAEADVSRDGDFAWVRMEAANGALQWVVISMGGISLSSVEHAIRVIYDDLWMSDNEMWFSEDLDESERVEYYEAMKRFVEKHGLAESNAIEFGQDNTVTIYPVFISLFVDDRFIKKPKEV